MIGALIGDLAAWTWEHDHSKFYPQLFSDVAQKSDYSDVMLQTAKLLLQYPNISLPRIQQYRREIPRYSQYCYCKALVALY